MKPYILSDDVYNKVMDILNNDMDTGLGKKTHENAIVKMFPTYVRSLPNGTGKIEDFAVPFSYM